MTGKKNGLASGWKGISTMNSHYVFLRPPDNQIMELKEIGAQLRLVRGIWMIALKRGNIHYNVVA